MSKEAKKQKPKSSGLRAKLGIDIETRGERFISISSGEIEPVIDQDARTARFSISSEAPVFKPQRGYFEILDHSPESVDLGRLKDGANIIVNHDGGRVAGIVEDAEIVNKRVETLGRFSANSQEGKTLFADIVDGIQRNVSFGYDILDAKLEGKTPQGAPIIRATKWAPFEVTFTGIPADQSVGVGRSLEKEFNTMSEVIEDILDDEDNEAAEPAMEQRDKDGGQNVAGQLRELEAEATKKERQRVQEITELGERFKRSKKVVAAASIAINKGTSVEEFRSNLLQLIQDGETRQSVPTNLGMTDKEVERYSLLRMMRAQVEAKARGVSPDKIAPYEYAIHNDLMDALPAKRADEVRGLLVPFDVQSRGLWAPRREMRAPPADTTENVHLVSTDHLADRFIEAIRQTSAVMAAGATSLTGLVGDVSIPREEAIPMEWLTEDEEGTDVDYVTSTVTLSPTTVSGHVPITRRLLKQSSPDADMIIRNNLVLGAGQEIDKQSLQGTGLPPIPRGIRNQVGVLEQDITAATLTWAQAVGFESKVEVGSNLINGASYIMHPTMKGIAKTTSKDTGSGMFIWAGGQVNDYPAFSSSHAGDANGIVFGNFANLLVGFWGVLDVLMDEYTKAKSGGLVVRVFQDVDMAVRRANAFCIENVVP